MKYSFIIPIYNGEKYLRECLASVLSQTVQDFEVLLVDDGSTDGSGKICDEYEKKYARIRVFHKENEGVSVARNLALNKALGDYICFVDCDDVISPFLLEAAEQSGGCDLLFFHNTRKSESQLLQEPSFDGMESLGKEERQRIIDKIIYDNHRVYPNINCNTVTTKVFSRTAIGESRFPKGIAIGEDKLFNFEVFQKARSMAYLPICAYYCRNHEASVMHQYAPNYFDNAEESFILFQKMIQDGKKQSYYTQLLGCRTVPVLRNLLELNLCHSKNRQQYKEKKQAWENLMRNSLIAKLYKICDVKKLCGLDGFYFYAYQHRFFSVNLLTKHWLVRAVMYVFYRFSKGA